MQQLQSIDQDCLQRPEGRVLACGVVRIVQAGLHHLNVPVAELIPEVVYDLLHCDAQLIALHIAGDILYQGVQLRQDPFVHRLQLGSGRLRHGLAIHVHHDETGGIPHLVGEITAVFYPFIVETHVVPGGVAGDQRKPQGIRAVLVDDLQRVDAVAQGFGHLPALAVPDQSVEQHCVERLLAHVLETGEDHPDDPEKDDVVARHQHVRGIEIL